MIPKIIHYCWFGPKSMPKEVHDCIASWKKYCPDYEIKLWNEENFPYEEYIFSKEAYQQEKFAFVSDVARIYALVKEGGIYLDTDIEIIKSIDDLLNNTGFAGFEDNNFIGTGIIASVKNGEIVEQLYNKYLVLDKLDIKLTSPILLSNVLNINDYVLDNNLQIKNKLFTLFPRDYFAPKSYLTGLINISKNTYAIHHYDASWLDNKQHFYDNQNQAKVGYYIDEAINNSISKEYFIKIVKNRLRISNKDLIKYGIIDFFNNIINSKK